MDMTTTIITPMPEPDLDGPSLYRLLSWLSPSYPVGAFTHSGGLEWAVEAGWVRRRADLEDWIAGLLDHGMGWSDAVLFTAAHRAVIRQDGPGLAAVAELAAAAHPSKERRIEALSQGEAFRRIAAVTLPAEALAPLAAVREGELAYPVAVAALVAAAGIGPAPSLTAYLHAFLANLVSAGQRLVPLGQIDGQTAIQTLAPVVLAVVARALALPGTDPFDHLGGACWSADLASMLHETQYTRLFRT
jgi:urease accessory protein